MLKCDMRSLEMAKVLVVKDFVKYAVGVPWGAAADEFAVGCAQSVEDGVVEFLVVSDKVEFIRENHIECGASDCVGVVWEGFYAASVGKVDLGFLRFKNGAGRQFMREGGYACDYSFGLAPAGSDYADCGFWVGDCVF